MARRALVTGRQLVVPDHILQSAYKSQTSVSLKQMLDYGEGMSDAKLINSAKFLHHELPIRLAHRWTNCVPAGRQTLSGHAIELLNVFFFLSSSLFRVKDLSKLPLGLNEQKSVQTVRDWYMQVMAIFYVVSVCTYG